MEIDGILKFVKLTEDFRAVERTILVNSRESRENDVEHSYQLAMVSWYIISAYKLDLNIDKVIKYALLHDLVEVYAGDTYIFDPNPEVHASKHQREKDALDRLRLEFSDFAEMSDLIENYENRDDEESKFVYALDKIIAPISIYLDKGRTWQYYKVTFDQLIENKTNKVKVHPEIEKYFLQLKELLEQNKENLFYKDNEKI